MGFDLLSAKYRLSNAFDALNPPNSIKAGRSQLSVLKHKTGDVFHRNSTKTAKQKQNKAKKPPQIRHSSGLSSGLGEFVSQLILNLSMLPLLVMS